MAPSQRLSTQNTDGFLRLVGRRRWLALTLSLFTVAFYLLQVALSVFTHVLDGFAVGAVTWAWVYTLGQFAVPLMVLHVYQARSAALDAEAAAFAEHGDD